MFDPFSYAGPKCPERLEDERYVRMLIMRESASYAAIADAFEDNAARIKSMLWRIERDCDLADAGRPCPRGGRPRKEMAR